MTANQYEVIQCTPAVAMRFLEKNTNNRKMRPDKVKALTQLIQDGQWRNTGDPIRIGKDGTLLDGQHRLAAIVAAGQPVELSVLWDFDKNPFVDTGAKRTTSDSIRINNDGMDWVTSRVTSALNALNEQFPALHCADNASMANYLRAYEDELKEVGTLFVGLPARRNEHLQSAACRAAFYVARIDDVSFETLKHAMDILRRGYGDGGLDHTLDALTQSLSKSKKRRNNKESRRAIFFRTCWALYLYNAGVTVERQETQLVCPFSIYNANHQVVVEGRKPKTKGDN